MDKKNNFSIVKWYKNYKKYTIRSIFIPLNNTYIDYLKDGILLFILL